MPAYYTYLISSLPLLQFEAKPPFSFEDFIKMCQGLIPETEIELIKLAGAKELIYEGRNQALKKWQAFDTLLRNELVKIRAVRKKLDSAKYLRKDGLVFVEPFITHIALSAHRNPSLLEAEKTLDQTRWAYLDDLAIGHYFDLDFLIVYAQKLVILERWERIRTADKPRILEDVLKD